MGRKKKDILLLPLEKDFIKIEEEKKKKNQQALNNFNQQTKFERELMESTEIINEKDEMESQIKYLNVGWTKEYPTDIPLEFKGRLKKILDENSGMIHLSDSLVIMRDDDTNEMFYNDEKLGLSDNMQCFHDVSEKIDNFWKNGDRDIDMQKKKIKNIKSDLVKCEEPHFKVMNTVKEFLLLTPEEQEKRIKKD